MLNIKKFLNVSVRLAFEAAKIIEQLHPTIQKSKVMKGIDDPVTEADFRIQKMISRVLHQHWPNLTIVGEESLHGSVKSTNVDLKDIDRDLTTEPYLSDQTEDLAIKDSCVWIDPVDGTLSYTEGYLDEVSTLIGLSYKNRARLGVIGLPYLSSPLYKYSPRVFFGSSTHRRVYQINQQGQLKSHLPRKIPFDFTVTTSRIDSEQQCRRLRQVTSKVITSSGSGRKMHQVIVGEADAMAYFGNRCCRWDTCAGEALITGLGGTVTGLGNQTIHYNPHDKHYYNQDSVICTLDKRAHQRILVMAAKQ